MARRTLARHFREEVPQRVSLRKRKRLRVDFALRERARRPHRNAVHARRSDEGASKHDIDRSGIGVVAIAGRSCTFVPPSVWAIGLAEQLGAPIPVVPILPREVHRIGRRTHIRRKPARRESGWQSIGGTLVLTVSAARGRLSAGMTTILRSVRRRPRSQLLAQTVGISRALLYHGVLPEIGALTRLVALSCEQAMATLVRLGHDVVSQVNSFLTGHARSIAKRRSFRPLQMAVLAFVLLVATYAATVASSQMRRIDLYQYLNSASRLPTFAPLQQRIVIQNQQAPSTQIGGYSQVDYVLGAWVSNMSPPTSGTVRLYVRVTGLRAQSVQMEPVPIVAEVRITCAQPMYSLRVGPVLTGADGIAIIPVTYHSLPVGVPVCITAMATVAGQKYTATTTFAAG